MRVCFFCRVVSLHARGGMQHDLDARASWLIEQGHEVDVITTRHPDLPAVLEHDSIHFHFLQETRPLKQDAIWRTQSIGAFLHLHLSNPFDLVICVGGGGWQYAQLRAERKDMPPAVMLMQTPILTILRYLLSKPTPLNLAKATRYLYYLFFWNRRYGSYLDAILVLSEWAIRPVLAEGSFCAERIHVVSNGVDTMQFCPGDASEKLRQELQITPEDIVAIWVGRFLKYKGWLDVLEASAEVASQFPRYRLLMVVAGMDRERQQFLREVRRLGIENRVQLIENVMYSDLPQYYRLGRILIAPFHGPEAQPLVLIEGMACGLPVVAYQIPSVVDMVRDQQDGLLVPQHPAHLAVAMIQLLSLNQSDYATFAQRAREHVVSRFDARRSAQRTIEILEAVAAGDRPRFS